MSLYPDDIFTSAIIMNQFALATTPAKYHCGNEVHGGHVCDSQSDFDLTSEQICVTS